MVYHYGWTAYSKVLQWDIILVHGQNFLFIRAISEKETNKQNINICMKNNFTRKKKYSFLPFFIMKHLYYIIPTATDPRRWNNNFTKKKKWHFKIFNGRKNIYISMLYLVLCLAPTISSFLIHTSHKHILTNWMIIGTHIISCWPRRSRTISQ